MSKVGAAHVAVASKDAASYVKTKMDESGVTEGAAAAGAAIYSAGVSGASTIK